MSRATRRAGRRSIPRGRQVSNKSSRSFPSMQLNSKGNQHAGRAMISTAIVLGMVVLFALGFGFLIVAGHSGSAASASGGGPVGNVPAGYGTQNHAKGPCGNAGQAACPAVNADWFAVPSASSNVVAAAIDNSKEYIAMRGSYGYTAMDAPALVHAYNAHTGNDYYDDDHLVVSVRDASGLRCGIFDFVYDRTHARMRFSSYGVITPEDPYARQAFPYIASSVALAQLQHSRGLHAMGGTQPELIFFPIDPSFPYLTSPVHKWSGGGNSAMSPIWHITGTDGHNYFMGADSQVYDQAQLPVAKGQP
ncbi:MAG TPA: hypothetical protein VF043_32940 [Ktedonobacteraceae bacterium]